MMFSIERESQKRKYRRYNSFVQKAHTQRGRFSGFLHKEAAFSCKKSADDIARSFPVGNHLDVPAKIKATVRKFRALIAKRRDKLSIIWMMMIVIGVYSIVIV